MAARASLAGSPDAQVRFMRPMSPRAGRSDDHEATPSVGVVQSVEAAGPADTAALGRAAGEMSSGALSPSAVLALQRSAGNQAAGRALAGHAPRSIQRDLLDTIGDVLNTRDDEERLDAEEDLEDFRDETYAPVTDFAPSSDVGLFDATCDMRAGTMAITLKVAYNFTACDPT